MSVPGLPQAFLAMKSSFDPKKEEKPVYGVATDGAEWILCIYKGGEDFQTSKPIEVMEDIDKKDVWMAGKGPDLIKILYTLFDSQIKYVWKPQSGPNVDEPMDSDGIYQMPSQPVESQQAETQRKEVAATAAAAAAAEIQNWLRDSEEKKREQDIELGAKL